MTAWVDDFLGPDYQQHNIPLGLDPDGEGDIHATLIRHHGVVNPLTATQAVVYVHGYTDYFFNTELAEFFANRGIAFYALDLRKCGRSRGPEQTPHYVTELAFYDAELEEAARIVNDEVPNAQVAFVAHSTGGLIVPLWLDRVNMRIKGTAEFKINGLILNSPWLDLQGSAIVRQVGTPLMRLLSNAIPTQALPLGDTGAYGRSIHKSAQGNWEFDVDLKPVNGFPIRIGWLNAIRRGHAAFHRGLDIGVPSLVMRSSRSFTSNKVEPKSMVSDTVLDVRQIARWAGCLGDAVTSLPIRDAMHDIFLSRDYVRENAYAVMADWIDRNLA